MYNFQEEFFDEVHAPSEKSMRSCNCVLGVMYLCVRCIVSILPLSTI
jgi:hypothetical protein